jgi:hypothetical protein
MGKPFRVIADGRKCILRIRRPWNVVGLEALATQRYNREAGALTGVSVCRILEKAGYRLGGSSHLMHLTLTQIWILALKEADDWLADLNVGTATQRVAKPLVFRKMPALTACLMVSCLDISISICKGVWCCANRCSMAAREPEPSSRTTYYYVGQRCRYDPS